MHRPALCAPLVALALALFALTPLSVGATSSVPVLPTGGDPSQSHSPQMQRMLAGGRPSTDPAAAQWPQGIDVSSQNHPGGAAIGWNQVAGAGYRFAYVKATEGNYYNNPYLMGDHGAALSAGLWTGAYHFANPSVSDGTTQADYFVDALPQRGRMSLQPMVDLEFDPYDPDPCYFLTPSQMVAWISDFQAEMVRRTGQLPIIYTAATWWNQCTGGSSAFDEDPLWIASYGTPEPTLPNGWRTWALWQYTSTGAVPGITGNVDLDYAHPGGGR
jgi:GH25 family lysozyme M1 (1,4-beta-N-acetylmuramidase)